KEVSTAITGTLFKIQPYGPLEIPPNPQKTPWLASTALDAPEEFCAQFWNSLRQDLDNGTFWHDEIKNYRNLPEQRLALAMRNLPLPAAFRESAIALRAIIRAAKKNKQDYTSPSHLLYWLAALKSFMLEYAPRAKQPGFNVIQYMPGEIFMKMGFSYDSLGYRELALLTQTDRKFFAQLWGEPRQHTTLNHLHRGVWEVYELQLIDSTKKAFNFLRKS